MEHTSPTLSTAYLPSTLYIAHLCHHKEVGIEACETYPKQTFRNRTVIVTGNGLLTLTVPVVRTHGNHTLTRDIGINYQEPWNVRHWRAIVSAYNAAPFFLYYRDELETLLMRKYDRLMDLNDALLSYIIKRMKLACTTKHTEEFLPPKENDMRNCITNKHPQTDWQFPHYSQVFDTIHGFQPNVSVIDLLFNLGPEAKQFLPRPYNAPSHKTEHQQPYNM